MEYQKQFVVDNRMCFVDAIDTEDVVTLRDQWIIRQAQGVILVYSVDSLSSIDELDKFYRFMRKVKGDNATLMLVGNKCDIVQERQVSKEYGTALSRQFGCEFFETSTKTTENVERLFTNLVRALRLAQTGDTESKQELHQSTKKERKPLNCVIM